LEHLISKLIPHLLQNSPFFNKLRARRNQFQVPEDIKLYI
jgi:hypothetical protein